MDNDSLFVEQAEYIAPSDFIEWSSDHPNEDVILKKLTQAGAKLLTGPRGCGKTTLMLKAYNRLNKMGSGGAFAIYVNFKASLKLEPIYKSKANGGFWFSQWMYLKIYEGIYKSLIDYKSKEKPDFHVALAEVEKIISLLELGEVGKVQDFKKELTVYDLEDDIAQANRLVGKTRCVLILDDAAHAFFPEQQRDFFEFFRKIKSRTISPKAAIYPGVTNFAPTFNIGHDAEEIDAWVNPEDDSYIWFMKTMLARRLPKEVYEKLSKEESLLKVLCYASFGIPRIMLNMVRNVYVEDMIAGVSVYKTDFTKKNVMDQVKSSSKSVAAVYASLKQKLPTYKSYVEEGDVVFARVVELIKSYNKDKPVERKSITLAIRKEVGSDLKRILGFFQYAGLVSYKGQISRGEKGVFDLYLINLAALIESNALVVARAVKVEDIAISIETRHAHEFTRTQTDFLLPPDKVSLKLSMPPCQNCGEERSSEEARFCSGCGAALKVASIYDALVSKDIEVLALTGTRVKAIKSKSNIRNVRDILHDIGHKELRSVPQVGTYWASKIYYLAEEYIS